MSYGFKVKFVDNEAVAYDTYGEPPTDGEVLWINGHQENGHIVEGVDRGQINIGISFLDSDGFQSLSAYAARQK